MPGASGSARAGGGNCTLVVADDGPGPAGGSEAAVREGVGLGNTRQRLATLYGPAATLILAPGVGRGTEVIVRIPFHAAPGAPVRALAEATTPAIDPLPTPGGGS